MYFILSPGETLPSSSYSLHNNSHICVSAKKILAGQPQETWKWKMKRWKSAVRRWPEFSTEFGRKISLKLEDKILSNYTNDTICDLRNNILCPKGHRVARLRHRNNRQTFECSKGLFAESCLRCFVSLI